MQMALIGMLSLLLVSCGKPEGKLSEAQIATIRAAAPGITDDCLSKIRSGGISAMPQAIDTCFQMTKSSRWRGLWRNDFEGSQFCAAPERECSYIAFDRRTQPLIWLDFAQPLPTEYRRKRMGGLYAVDFIGRRTAFRGHYGHMGMFDEEVIVDRMISIKQVEVPRKN